MSVVYSTRFLAWAEEELATPYVVPTGYLVIVRDVDVSSNGGAITNWVWGINGICKISGGQFTIEALLQHQEWRGRQVVNAGEAIYFQSDQPTDGAISGYLLTDLE